MVSHLLEMGADVLAKDGIGATALIMAAAKGATQVRSMLQAHPVCQPKARTCTYQCHTLTALCKAIVLPGPYQRFLCPGVYVSRAYR